MISWIKKLSMLCILATPVACGGGGGGDDTTPTDGDSGTNTGGGTDVTVSKTFSLSLSEISVIRTVNDAAVAVDIGGISSGDLTYSNAD